MQPRPKHEGQSLSDSLSLRLQMAEDPGLEQRLRSTARELLRRDPMREDESYLNPESIPKIGLGEQAIKNLVRASGEFFPDTSMQLGGEDGIRVDLTPTVGSVKRLLPSQVEAAIAQKAVKDPSFVSRLFHGTNANFDRFNMEKTGPVASFTDQFSTAKSYAGGFGGQRRRPKIQEQIFFNERDGLLYEHRGVPGKNEWFESVGKLDTRKPFAEPTPENILPIEGPVRTFDWGDFKELHQQGYVQPFDKQAKVIQKDFGDLNILDTRTKRGLETIADTKPSSHIGKVLTDAAKKDLTDPYGRLGAEFGFQFWPVTKFGKRHTKGLEDFIAPLKKAGYDAIYHGDDGHNTFGLFDTGLSKEIRGGKYLDPRLYEELVRRSQEPSLEEILQSTRPKK